MSSSSKVVIWIIVVLVIIIGGFIYFTHMSGQPAYPNASATSTDNSINGIPERNDDGASVSATDTSNAALDSDMSNVDGQMNSLNNDSANADAGMSASSTQ